MDFDHQIDPVFFYFGKTTEILGKMKCGENKISVDFFLPRKIHRHFCYTNIPKKSSIKFQQGKLDQEFSSGSSQP